MATRKLNRGTVVSTVVHVAMDQLNRLIDTERLLVVRREALQKTLGSLTTEQLAEYMRLTADKG